MAQQTSVEWLIMQLPVSIRLELYAQDIQEQAKEKHKEDCINFSIEWENRRDDEDIKSKEDLYDSIYKNE
jgi:hypothetical protein